MAAKKNTKNLTFEERLRRLQEVVAALESGTDDAGGAGDGLSLERSVALYKEGLALSRACREQLDKVRNEVRLLSGDGLSEPFAARDAEPDFPDGGSDGDGARRADPFNDFEEDA